MFQKKKKNKESKGKEKKRKGRKRKERICLLSTVAKLCAAVLIDCEQETKLPADPRTMNLRHMQTLPTTYEKRCPPPHGIPSRNEGTQDSPFSWKCELLGKGYLSQVSALCGEWNHSSRSARSEEQGFGVGPLSPNKVQSSRQKEDSGVWCQTSGWEVRKPVCCHWLCSQLATISGAAFSQF